jgi:hypothetical protein
MKRIISRIWAFFSAPNPHHMDDHRQPVKHLINSTPSTVKLEADPVPLPRWQYEADPDVVAQKDFPQVLLHQPGA